MSRQVVAGMLGLALAGCAQDRSVVSRPGPTVSPVELTSPLPSIHETINQENAQVDVDSIRAGHPVAAARPQGRAARIAVADAEPGHPAPREDSQTDGPAPPATTATETETVASETPAPHPNGEPDAPAGRLRPAPFRGVTGRPRPRANPVPVAAEAPAADGPRPESVATAPESAPLSDPVEMKDSAAPAPAPAPGLAAEAPEPAAPTEPQGRVKVQVPGDGQAAAGAVSPPSSVENSPAPEAPTAMPPTGTPRPIGRDPLLGPDPDIMPSFDVLPAPPRAVKDKAPAAEIPAESPAQADPLPPAAVDPAPVAVPEPAAAPEAPAAPPVVRLAPPTEIDPGPVDASANRAETSAPLPEALPAAVDVPQAPVPPTAKPGPAPAGDPLLGPNPDVMPSFDLPPARASAVPSRDGTPPSVREIEGIDPPPAVSPPVESAPAPAPGPDPARILPPPAVLPGGTAQDPPVEAPRPTPTKPDVPAVTVNRPEGPASPPAAADLIDLQPEAKAPKPAPEAAGTSAPAPLSPGRDPLLGANPDIMPNFELPPEPRAAKAPEPAASPDVPASKIRPRPAPAPAHEPAASKPAPAPAPKPARAVEPKSISDAISDPVDLPPLSNPEASNRVVRNPSEGFASVPVSAPPEKTLDPEVRHAGGDPTAVRSRIEPRSVFEAGRPAAWVGSEVITLHDLKFAFKQRRKEMPADQPLSPEVKYMMARSLLDHMVDRAVIVQEARRELKEPKKFQKFMEMADSVFFEHEVPPMLRQTTSADVAELKKKLAERGESLDELRENFRLEFLSQGYVEQKIGSKIKVDLPEMREYYLNHLRDFDLPAQVAWREVVVEVHANQSRARAKEKADALLARLRRGEDLATVAKAESDGPNKSDGGLWATTPGSYVVPAVNSALETLPVGRLSPVIEGPTSYHIVRVEARRQAGPATFAAVQDQVYKALRRKKVQTESTAFVDKLRKRTVIRTVFDDPQPVTRASAEIVQPATRPSRR